MKTKSYKKPYSKAANNSKSFPWLLCLGGFLFFVVGAYEPLGLWAGGFVIIGATVAYLLEYHKPEDTKK